MRKSGLTWKDLSATESVREISSGEKAVQALFVVQLFSHVRLFATPWTAALQGSMSFTISWSLFKLMSIESVMPSNHPILCHPLLLPSIFPSIRVFSNESALHIRWPKYWGFSFSIIPSNEYSGLVSFRIDWFHLLTVQTTLKGISLCRGFCVLEEDDRKGMTNPPESICKHFLSSSSEGIWENHRKGTSASCTTLPSGTRVL